MTPVDRNLSILIVLPGLSAGGVERVVSNIANYWQSKGHQITIAIFTRSHVPFYTLNSEITIRNFAEESRVSKLLGIHSIWIFIFLLRKLIKIQSPNVVLSFLPQVNIITILAAIGLQARTIISERNEISKKQGEQQRRTTGRQCKQQKQHIGNSSRRLIINRSGSPRWREVYRVLVK